MMTTTIILSDTGKYSFPAVWLWSQMHPTLAGTVVLASDSNSHVSQAGSHGAPVGLSCTRSCEVCLAILIGPCCLENFSVQEQISDEFCVTSSLSPFFSSVLFFYLYLISLRSQCIVVYEKTCQPPARLI